MEEEAIYIGLSLPYFWSLNPKQFEKHCKVYVKKQEEEIKLQDTLNHILGQYVGIAVNDGKKYPRKPLLSNNSLDNEKPKQTIEEMEKIMKYNTAFLGGKINGNNS